MKRKIFLSIFCCVCAAMQVAAQTTEQEGMSLVPAGKFWMGRAYKIFLNTADLLARDRMDDIPANNVYVDAFYIDKYEVTNEDFARYVAATNAKAPWHWRDGKVEAGEEKLPVANVTWFEANDYCK